MEMVLEMVMIIIQETQQEIRFENKKTTSYSNTLALHLWGEQLFFWSRLFPNP